MYSRKRLALFAAIWLLAGAAFFVFSPEFGTSADPRGCVSTPCSFPAENNIGGIVLATDQIAGEGITAFGVARSPRETSPVAPGRVESEENQIGIGVNNLETGKFLIYKNWDYYDTRTQDYENVYIWANSSSAELSGSGQCGVGDQDNDYEGAFNCDLLANASEVALGYLWADLSSAFLVPDTLSDTNIHVVNPSDDTCGELEGLSNPCLQLLQDGGVCVLSICTRAQQVYSENFFIRTHEATAKRGPDDNADKTLKLNDPYLEIRYGKGYDRVYTPQSSAGNVTQEAVDSWAQPIRTPQGVEGLSRGYLCQGAGSNTSCDVKPGRIADDDTQAFDNIHE